MGATVGWRRWLASGGSSWSTRSVDLGGGLRARIARPREPGRLLDEAVADGAERCAVLGGAVAVGARVRSAARRADLLGRARGRARMRARAAVGRRGPAGRRRARVDHDADAVRVARTQRPASRGRVRGPRRRPARGTGRARRGGAVRPRARGGLLYDEALASALATLIPLLTAPGGRALVAFPWPGQADELAARARARGHGVSLRELPVPGLPRARAVGLLEASRARMPRTHRLDSLSLAEEARRAGHNEGLAGARRGNERTDGPRPHVAAAPAARARRPVL